MSRTINVVDADGKPDYVVVEFRRVVHRPLAGPAQSKDGAAEFFLSNGDVLNLISADRFEDMNGFAYYAQEEDDIDWLSKINPER